MSTLETILVMLLVVDAIGLAVLVLLQQGKGADVGAAFGSGGASTVFGSAGSASFMTRLTVWLAIGFFLISFALAYTAKERAAAEAGLGLPLLDAASSEESADSASKNTDKIAAEASLEASEDASAADEKLTTESERVDSDIPEL